MSSTPEAQARIAIDRLLSQAGWIVQDMADFNRQAADDSLDDVDSLPAPDVIAAEIVDNLQAALDAFQTVANELAPAR